jgi:hypothetical protein
MLLPGSKGWIHKYFSLIEEKLIDIKYQKPSGISVQRHLHLLSGKTGIVFGHSSRFLFYNAEESSKWTEDEKLKLLLFETLLLTYIQKNGITTNLKEDFIDSLLSYYSKYSSKGIQSIFTFFVKEDKTTKLETIFSKRIDVSKGIFDNRWWFKTISNVFVYLDVILYNRFVNEEDSEVLRSYSEYAYNSLISILLAAYSDGIVDDKEESMFKIFLSSANLEGEYKEKALHHLKSGVSYSNFTDLIEKDRLFCRFLIDLSLLTIFGNHDIELSEKEFVTNLAKCLGLEDYDVEESMVMIENFLLYSDVRNSFLGNKNVYEKVYGNFTSRWTKVILRNKDKLAIELSESKELVSLIKKSATQDLSSEEKEKVKTQFMDIVRSMPALAIFMLPGGAILLPLILKVLPDLIPSAFRDNEIDK